MDLDREFTVKLPLLGKSIELDALPGQDPTVRYGVVWDACQQPGDGFGYIVRFNESRDCNLLAWMTSTGVVHECDRPIAFVTPGVPVLATFRSAEGASTGVVRVRRHGSDELVTAAGFRDYFPNQVAFTPVEGKGPGLTTEEDLEQVLGPFVGHRLGWRVFVAASYLAFYLLPRLASGARPATGTIGDVLRRFTAQPLPDVVDSLIFRVLEAQEATDVTASGFERYAARMLEQAGSSELRSIAARHEISVARLASTGLFWMRFDSEVTPEERAVLLSIESCLNRLALIELRLRAAGDSTTLAEVRESRCATEDRNAIARIADLAPAHMDASQDENPYCTYVPAVPARGGEWDVRTRFLQLCESLRLPFRLEYRFDCHADAGMLDVRIGLPLQRAFPDICWNTTESRWENCADEVPARATCYALRLAALVAACGFGTSLGMRQVVVTGCEGDPSGRPLLSMRFERISFLNRALYRIDMGTVSRIGRQGKYMPSDATVMLSLLAPMEAHVELAEDGGLQPVEALPLELGESRLPVSRDERYLPAPLAHLLHADRVRDLDVDANTDMHQLDEVHTAVEDAAESRLLAIACLEGVVERNPVKGLVDPSDIVAAAEAALQGDETALPIPGYDKPDGEGGTRPVRIMYFPNLMTRCLVDAVSRREDEDFEPLPAQAYLARAALVKLYVESGDIDAAVARARECAALAPTSSGLLLELAQLMLAAKRSNEAIAFLRQALNTCVRQQMATAIYAHLAGAFWACGKLSEALAAFTFARGHEQGQTAFDQAILQLVQQLGVKEMPSMEQAASTLRAQGIPRAPRDEIRRDALSAAIGFTDARMLELAWPLVGSIGIDIGNDVMAMMGDHLRRGVE